METIALLPYTENQLRSLIYHSVKIALEGIGKDDPNKPEPFIKGIHELAKFLRVSPARAQKLKNEGIIPFWQDGRTLLSDPGKVRDAMSSKKN